MAVVVVFSCLWENIKISNKQKNTKIKIIYLLGNEENDNHYIDVEQRK